MILASVAKLNKYKGETYFDMVYSDLTASQDEGLSYFKLDVIHLDPEVRIDFMNALTELGYDVSYDDGEELIEAHYE